MLVVRGRVFDAAAAALKRAESEAGIGGLLLAAAGASQQRQVPPGAAGQRAEEAHMVEQLAAKCRSEGVDTRYVSPQQLQAQGQAGEQDGAAAASADAASSLALSGWCPVSVGMQQADGGAVARCPMMAAEPRLGAVRWVRAAYGVWAAGGHVNWRLQHTWRRYAPLACGRSAPRPD